MYAPAPDAVKPVPVYAFAVLSAFAVVAVVAVAALPEVFWLPVVLTPGRLMSAEPLKLTPPILRAV